ncbi:glycoside hydrolase family 6 protein [Dactylosporangium sp. NPDC051484]|uniref:glycoside hydrolase family 6 protein n=1 Tax=Dactylosporangium sp. NPDC051484 TaxID=3154942 RepID=UPI00344FB55C
MANVVAGGGARMGSVVLAFALAVLSGCDRAEPPESTGSAGPADLAAYRDCTASSAPTRPVAGNPLAARPFFVEPSGPAAQQVADWGSRQRTADAAALRRISDRPVAQWVGGGAGSVGAQVDAVLGCAAAQGQLPVLVAYNIPHRDCGSYSSGGAASPDEYRSWIRAFASGVRGRPVAIILEPDAIPHAIDGCESESRYELLSDAVQVLKATGSAVVYLDAGHPRWITDVHRLAEALRRSGIAHADGFSLNVSNFVSTPDNVAYGKQVSSAVPSKPHFVIDTSRNGAGEVETAGDVDGGPRWCNPPGRLLGMPPTTDTGDPRVDALLWIKRPGESDGACRPGEPPAGQWWPEYALDLAQRST